MMEHTERRLRCATFICRAAIASALLLFAFSIAQAQAVRLEGSWQFLPDRDGSLKLGDINRAQGWRDVRVALSWNAQFADLRDYMGVAWYRTTFVAPDVRDGHVLLRFGAVDYFSEVFVNGKQVGTHEGGYTPFTFDVTSVLRSGTNDLVVRVTDPPMDEKENRSRFPDMLYHEIPHGKQNWYVQTGGIWQPVWLEVKPKEYITSVKVLAKVDGSLRVLISSNAHLGPPAPAPTGRSSARQQTILDRIKVRVFDPAGQAQGLKLKGGGGVAENDYVYFSGRIRNPKLWASERPNLYTVEVKLGDDTVTDHFGFRSFEARNGRFFLNDKPFYMLAALDQDFYPDTIYTAPSEEYVRDMMLKAKRLGLNLLRCHIKVCEPTYLKVADEVGMLVWYEVPSWNDFNHFSPKAAERGEAIFRAMLERDWNHPSIVIQSIINEGWGTNLPEQVESRRWLRAAFDRAKQLTVPLDRLIVDNSACCANFHLKTDIEDNHRYNSIPDEHEPFDNWVAEFAARPKWNFSPHGDAEPTGHEPLVLSEFGNWGLPKLPPELPWWFERDFAGQPVTRPAGLYERFAAYKFARLFPNYDSLATATQWHQFISLKHEIEEIRRHPSIQGYVITEFTDINWEANGLLSMWREPKIYAAELTKIQQPDIVIARSSKSNYNSGELVEFDVLLSHYSQRDLKGAKLNWHIDEGEPGKSVTLQSGKLLDRELAPASVMELGRQSFTAPVIAHPQRLRILLEVRDRADRLVAENSAEVFIYPLRKTAPKMALSFYDPRQALKLKAQQLTSAGYTIKTDLAEPDPHMLLIAGTLDDKVERQLRAGGRVLLLANAADALPAGASIKLTPRVGSNLDGNWVTNFNWVRADPPSPFSDLAFTKILGFESARVVPRLVIQGIPSTDYDDVLSGIFYGWLNNNAALAVQMRAGRGKVLLTTFRFDEYGSDPYATQLLDAMIDYTSGNFAPHLEYSAKQTATP